MKHGRIVVILLLHHMAMYVLVSYYRLLPNEYNSLCTWHLCVCCSRFVLLAQAPLPLINYWLCSTIVSFVCDHLHKQTQLGGHKSPINIFSWFKILRLGTKTKTKCSTLLPYGMHYYILNYYYYYYYYYYCLLLSNKCVCWECMFKNNCLPVSTFSPSNITRY